MPARRRDLRSAFRALRRHEVTLAAWQQHVDGYFAALGRRLAEEGRLDEGAAGLAERRAALQAWTRQTLKPLAGPRAVGEHGFFAGLRGLLARAWKGHTRPGPAGANVKASRLCLQLLEELNAERAGDEAVSGLDSRQALEVRRRLLAERLRARSRGEDHLPRHGVRLTSYLAWDGTPGQVTVLAGLEEGGFPIAPARRSRDDEAWATALGLPAPEAELDRQARLAAAAARATHRLLVLSASRTDEAGSETFPGALLGAFETDEELDPVVVPPRRSPRSGSPCSPTAESSTGSPGPGPHRPDAPS